MKFNSKHKAMIMVLPVAILLASCGKKTAEGTAASSTLGGATSNVTSTTNNNNNGNNGNTGSNSCNHPIVSYTTPFTYGLSGNGNTTKSTPSGVIHADQDLRVQVTPGSAIVNSTGSGTKQYTKMGVSVTLQKNGVDVSGATVTIPGGTSATTGLRNGLAVGTKSTIVDFSTYLSSGSNTYSIKVSNIMSDYTCKTYCTESNPQYWLWNGYYYYPDYTMINACKQLQCDVGSVDNAAGWSLSVQVETDNTPCLTQ